MSEDYIQSPNSLLLMAEDYCLRFVPDWLQMDDKTKQEYLVQVANMFSGEGKQRSLRINNGKN